MQTRLYPQQAPEAARRNLLVFSTLNPNDYLIGAIAVMPASGNAPNPTSGAGFSNIQSNHQGSIGGGVESESVTSVQNSASVNCSTGGTSVSWAMIGDAVQGALPALSVNTAFSSTSSTGSVSISNGQSAFLWSPAYPSATTVNAGSWLLYLWALSATSDTMNVQLAATDSTGAITAVAASGNTGAIGTAKAEVKTTFSGLQISVPSGGHLLVILTNLAGGSSSFTIYWGSGQATNFRTPSLYNYALRVVNSAAVSFSVSFSAYSSSFDYAVNKHDNVCLHANNKLHHYNKRRLHQIIELNAFSLSVLDFLLGSERNRD